MPKNIVMLVQQKQKQKKNRATLFIQFYVNIDNNMFIKWKQVQMWEYTYMYNAILNMYYYVSAYYLLFLIIY